jgi:hypothetical protein
MHKIGDVYDYFGQEWTVERIRKAKGRVVEIWLGRDHRDEFGKNVPERKLVAVYHAEQDELVSGGYRKISSRSRDRSRRARDNSPAYRKRLLMAVYKRMPIGNKHLRGGKHTIMFTGSSASAYGVPNYATVLLEELETKDLERAARAIGARLP